jgi:hypothetical protein
MLPDHLLGEVKVLFLLGNGTTRIGGNSLELCLAYPFLEPFGGYPGIHRQYQAEQTTVVMRRIDEISK